MRKLFYVMTMTILMTTNISAKEVSGKNCLSITNEDYHSSIEIINKISLRISDCLARGEKPNAIIVSAIKSTEELLSREGCTTEEEERLRVIRSKYKKATEY